jgi:hypothetical protein
VYFVLAVAAASNAEAVRLSDLRTPTALAMLVCGITWGIGYALTRQTEKAALISLLMVLAFATYGYVVAALTPSKAIRAVGGDAGVLALYVVIVAGVIPTIRRASGRFEALLHYCTVLGLLLVAYTSYAVRRSMVREPVASSPTLNTQVHQMAANASRGPDVFLIIVDKYTGLSLLQSNYGFDDGEFRQALEARQFRVPAIPRANYTHTFLALASMLNLRYLDDLPPRLGVDNPNWALSYPLVEKNELATFLQSRGYRFVFFPTAFGATRENRFADLQLPSPAEIRPEFTIAWARTTALPILRQYLCGLLGCPVLGFPYIPESAGLINWKLQQVAQLAGGEQPVFAFLHLTVPHEPYLFRADCSVREPYWPERDDGPEGAAVKAAYTEQITCLNRKLIDLVDAIRARSTVPPIILIQADHGHGRLGRDLPALQGLPPEKVAERLSVFAAYHFPGLPADSISDHITPVNAVRLMLREYFDTPLQPVPDVSYWSSADRPYLFTRMP